MNVCSPKLPVTSTTYSIRFSHLSSLLPWDAETNAQIYKNNHSLFTIAKQSSLVFSVLNKLIRLDVHRFWFESFLLLFFHFFRRSLSVQCEISWLITFSSPEFYFFFFYSVVRHILYHFQRKFKLIQKKIFKKEKNWV